MKKAESPPQSSAQSYAPVNLYAEQQHPASRTAEDRFWGELDELEVSSLHDQAKAERVFDLEERTALFGESVIEFAKKVPQTPINKPLITQLVAAGTSVGANYCEADDGVTKKDFKNKIGTCRKESKESKFWLRMIAKAEPGLKDEARVLWREAKELNLIFGSIWRKP